MLPPVTPPIIYIVLSPTTSTLSYSFRDQDDDLFDHVDEPF
jgi:hypothetical protein